LGGNGKPFGWRLAAHIFFGGRGISRNNETRNRNDWIRKLDDPVMQDGLADYCGEILGLWRSPRIEI